MLVSGREGNGVKVLSVVWLFFVDKYAFFVEFFFLFLLWNDFLCGLADASDVPVVILALLCLCWKVALLE